jgi:UDP-glucose 4-epimerase
MNNSQSASPAAFSSQPECLACKNKNLLITGGAGFLASGLVELLKNIDCRITRIHRKDSPPVSIAGEAQIRDVTADVRDPSTWERDLAEFDYIFHFAAQTSTYVANDDPIADQKANVLPMLYLLESCRLQGVQPMICFASTVTIAGIPQYLPVDENHPDHPLTIYDLHKSMAEQYLSWYAEQGYVRGVTLRLANVYGPGPRSSRSDRGILNQMIHKALSGETLNVYGAGDQMRDYLYVEDAGRAFLSVAPHIDALNGKYYVIGSGRGHTIAEATGLVADRAGARTGIQVEIRQVVPPHALSPIEQRHFVADSCCFYRATGWEPLYTLVDGIDKTLEAYS